MIFSFLFTCSLVRMTGGSADKIESFLELNVMDHDHGLVF